MARTGRFGRLPRQAPDLTGAIVAMLREYQAQRQRNMTDAWKNGGEFEGKKVTDEMLLQFFDDRMKNLDPTDPLYDEAKNTREQYAFAIRNSKTELSYTERNAEIENIRIRLGKAKTPAQYDAIMAEYTAARNVNEMRMVQFYETEAARHPQNSEQWRSLMNLAAQYRDRAAQAQAQGAGGGGGGGGGGRGGRSRAHETPTREELAFTVIEGALLDLARQRGIVNSGQALDTTTETTGQGFGDLQMSEGDFSGMVNLIDELATSPDYAQWRNDATDFIRENGDPEFDGDFSMQGIIAAREAHTAALQRRLEGAYASGAPKSDIKAIQKELTLSIKSGSFLRVVDPVAALEQHRAIWEREMYDQGSTPLDRLEASMAYRDRVNETHGFLQREAMGVGAADGGYLSVLAGRALTELRALNGEDADGPTLWETTASTQAGSGEDALGTAETMREIFQQTQLLATGEYAITRLGTDGLPAPEPSPEEIAAGTVNNTYGIAPVTALLQSETPVMFVGDPRARTATGRAVPWVGQDGQPTRIDMSRVLTTVVGRTMVARPVGGVDAAGRPISAVGLREGTRQELGAEFVGPNGVTIYQYFDSAGTRRYSIAPPFRQDFGSQLQRTVNAQGEVEVQWIAETDPLQASADGTINQNQQLMTDPLNSLGSDYLRPTQVNAERRTNAEGQSWLQGKRFSGLHNAQGQPVMVDFVYQSPEQAALMSNSVFTSAYLAYRVAENRAERPLDLLKDPAFESIIAVESGGRPDVAEAMRAEARLISDRTTRNYQTEQNFLARQQGRRGAFPDAPGFRSIDSLNRGPVAREDAEANIRRSSLGLVAQTPASTANAAREMANRIRRDTSSLMAALADPNRVATPAAGSAFHPASMAVAAVANAYRGRAGGPVAPPQPVRPPTPAPAPTAPPRPSAPTPAPPPPPTPPPGQSSNYTPPPPLPGLPPPGFSRPGGPMVAS